MEYHIFSLVVSGFGAGLALCVSVLSLLIAAPTLFSLRESTGRAGCLFFSSALLFFVIAWGLAGPVIGFTGWAWMVYRLCLVAAMAHFGVNLYRFHQALMKGH